LRLSLASSFVGWIFWDPSPVFFYVPLLGRPIAWYGVFFASGFFFGYFIFLKLLRDWLNHQEEGDLSDHQILDRLTWFVVLGTVLGARLGHVFFYDWDYFRCHPLDIFKIWEAGLASHGGALGVLVGLGFFRLSIWRRVPSLTFLTILDMLVIPTAFVGFCIRCGNFFNQEILGIPTTQPWAVVFGHPIDGGVPIPRHPVQLYEAGFYLAVFFFLWSLAKRRIGEKCRLMGSGLFSGLFFLLVFVFRMVVELVKDHQHSLLPMDSSLQMGQLLSIPFVVIGAILLLYSFQYRKNIV